MKKSTGIVFLVVVALAAFAYFHDWKGQPASEQSENPNAVQLAFKIQENDINQIQLTRAGVTMVFDRKDDGWHITQPVVAQADQSAVNAVAHSLSALPEDRTLQATAQQVNTYGLANPALNVEFKMKNGATHQLAMGSKDFSGLEVYARIDGSKDVALITDTAAAASDMPLDDFRDRTVLTFPGQDDVTALELKNRAGEISAKREGSGSDWDIVKPVATPGDSAAIAGLIDGVGDAKIDRFISDDAQKVSPSTLAQYGLSNPAVRLNLSLASGKSAELVIGKKEGLDYYAMDASRSIIFAVPDDVYTRINQLDLSALRAKVLFTGMDAEVSRLEVQNPKGTTKCVRDANGNLVIEQASGQSGQAPDYCPDFLTPLENAKAQKVEDQPSQEMRAKLAKPAIVVTLTEANSVPPSDSAAPASQSSKKMEIQISAASGNSVYAQTSAGQAVYSFNKSAFDALDGLKADTPAPAAQPATQKDE